MSALLTGAALAVSWVAASPNLYLGAFTGETNYLCLTPLMGRKVSWLAAFNALLHWRGSSDTSVRSWGWCLASRQEMGGLLKSSSCPVLLAGHVFPPVVKHSSKHRAWRRDLLSSAGASCSAHFNREDQQCPTLAQHGRMFGLDVSGGEGGPLHDTLVPIHNADGKKKKTIMYFYTHMYTYTHILKSIYTFFRL